MKNCFHTALKDSPVLHTGANITPSPAWMLHFRPVAIPIYRQHQPKHYLFLLTQLAGGHQFKVPAFKDERRKDSVLSSTPSIPSFPMSVSLLLMTVGLVLTHVCICNQLLLSLEERFSLSFSTSRFCPSLNSTSVLSDSMVCKWIPKPHPDKLTGKETERTRNASWSLHNNCLKIGGLKAYWWQSWCC